MSTPKPQWVEATKTRKAARTSALLLHPQAWVRRVVLRRKGMSLQHAIPKGSDAILERLGELPLSVWTYGFDHPSVRHLGPMAQDFASAFGLGDTDKAIDAVDANGVLMASVQALLRRVKALEARIAELEGEPTPPVE